MPGDHELGVDLGTSNTVAVWRRGNDQVRPLLFDASPMLPSAVYLETGGELLTGRDAVHAARRDPSRYEPNPKRRLADGRVLLGDREVDVVELLAAVLRRVADEAYRVCGGQPRRVTLTYPATWAATRRDALVAAARRAGLPEPRLIAEPVSAAGYFTEVLGNQVPVGSSVVVYDLGAGTFDASVMTRGADGFDAAYVDGLDLGGVDIDAAVVEWLARQYPDPRWDRLRRPADVADRRHREDLWADVRAAKEMLSRAASATLSVPLLDVAAHLTRTELEAMAAPLVGRTVDTLSGVLRHARVGPHRIAGLFLVGGGSRLPLVAAALHRALAVPATVIEQPELVVAAGSLQAPGAHPERTRILPVLPAPASAAPPVSGSPVSGPAGHPAPVPAGSPGPSLADRPGPATVSAGRSRGDHPGVPTASPGSAAGDRMGRGFAPTVSAPVLPRDRPGPAAGSPPAGVAPPGSGRRDGARPAGRGRRSRWAVLPLVLVLVLVAALGGAGWYAYREANRPARAADGRPAFVPADWKVAVPSVGVGWHNHRSRNGAGACAVTKAGMTVALPVRDGTGMFQCVGQSSSYSDVAVETAVRVDSGCAGIWLRTGDTRGYFIDRCKDSIELHLVSDSDPSAASLLKRWNRTGDRIGALVDGDKISVYADGKRLGIVKDGRIDAGRVDLGVFTGTDGSAKVVFSKAEVWCRPD